MDFVVVLGIGALLACRGATEADTTPRTFTQTTATSASASASAAASAADSASASAAASAADSASASAAASASASEPSLGVADLGIYPDLADRVQIALPAELDHGQLELMIDDRHQLAVLYHDDFPLKAYPLAAAVAADRTALGRALRPGDRAELAPLLARARVRALASGELAAPGDQDGDGLPDPLDVLIGGIKNALNAAPYIGGYQTLSFPGGDVPRDQGVCTDVIVRAVRNAGVDLQLELNRDIKRAPRAYPMVERANAHIDHRRVKTILPYFIRHWQPRTAALDDAADPLRPGDVVFMDTFPTKPGPDHVGIVSHRRGDSGLPLIINAWTDGFVASEMDLLSYVPVTHRFRIRP